MEKDHKPDRALDCGKIAWQAGRVENFIATIRWYADVALIQRRNTLAVAGHEASTTRLPWGLGFIFPELSDPLVGWGLLGADAGNTVIAGRSTVVDDLRPVAQEAGGLMA